MDRFKKSRDCVKSAFDLYCLYSLYGYGGDMPKDEKRQKFYIWDLEEIFGVRRTNIYYWERVGKIPKAKREPMSNYRYWFEEDIEAIQKLVKED